MTPVVENQWLLNYADFRGFHQGREVRSNSGRIRWAAVFVHFQLVGLVQSIHVTYRHIHDIDLTVFDDNQVRLDKGSGCWDMRLGEDGVILLSQFADHFVADIIVSSVSRKVGDAAGLKDVRYVFGAATRTSAFHLLWSHGFVARGTYLRLENAGTKLDGLDENIREEAFGVADPVMRGWNGSDIA